MAMLLEDWTEFYAALDSYGVRSRRSQKVSQGEEAIE